MHFHGKFEHTEFAKGGKKKVDLFLVFWHLSLYPAGQYMPPVTGALII
jgi:hypothetical protein